MSIIDNADKPILVHPDGEYTIVRLITTPVINRSRARVTGQYQRRITFIHVKALNAGDAVKKANARVALAHSTIWPDRGAPWQDHTVDWDEVEVPANTEPFVLRG
jgi:hypothetical protein